MKVPPELFLSSIEEKKVYYFTSTKLNTETPHHFVCIKRTDKDILILTVCTSKFETVKTHVEKMGLPQETLVWIKPKEGENPFTKDTYVNCNNSFTYTVEEFEIMYKSDTISHSGEISENHYNQILTGLHKSPVIEREVKDSIPQPE